MIRTQYSIITINHWAKQLYKKVDYKRYFVSQILGIFIVLEIYNLAFFSKLTFLVTLEKCMYSGKYMHVSAALGLRILEYIFWEYILCSLCCVISVDCMKWRLLPRVAGATSEFWIWGTKFTNDTQRKVLNSKGYWLVAPVMQCDAFTMYYTTVCNSKVIRIFLPLVRSRTYWATRVNRKIRWK